MNHIPIKTILIILKEFCVFIYKKRKNMDDKEKNQAPKNIDELIADLEKEQIRSAILESKKLLNIKPKSILLEERIMEITAAIHHCAIHKKPIPREWIIELDEWNELLNKGRK